MASTPSFEWVSQELERTTFLERLEARGTLRMVLREVGLKASEVTWKQMELVLRELFPEELRSRGVENGDDVCAQLLRGLVAASRSDDEPLDETPEDVFRRLDGS